MPAKCSNTGRTEEPRQLRHAEFTQTARNILSHPTENSGQVRSNDSNTAANPCTDQYGLVSIGLVSTDGTQLMAQEKNLVYPVTKMWNRSMTFTARS